MDAPRRIGNVELPPIDQVGYVVRDLDATVARYEHALRPLHASWSRRSPACSTAASRPTCTLRIAFGSTGNLEIEFIEVVSGASPHKEFVDAGREGIHHIRYRVPDCDATIAALARRGLRADLVPRHGLREVRLPRAREPRRRADRAAGDGRGEAMSSARTLPVLVGVGQVLQRRTIPAQAAEPLALMLAALEQAGEDAGAPKLLQRADSIYVVRGMWRYGDPGREIARRLGAAPARDRRHALRRQLLAGLRDRRGARRSRPGRREVVLVTGAENGRSAGQAQRQGVALRETEAPGAPDRKVAEDKAIFHDAELARGMNSASDVFAVIDSAIRFARGESLAAHAARIAELWAGFSARRQRQSPRLDPPAPTPRRRSARPRPTTR